MHDILAEIVRNKELRGWTEYQLAERADLPQSTISSWYRKQMLPSLTSLEKICNAFGITMSQFFAGSDDVYPLTQEQRTLLDMWSRLSKEQKDLLYQLMNTM